MQFLSVFPNIKKPAKFWYWWKNADVGRTQAVYHVISISFRSSFCKAKLCQVSSLCDMGDRF